MNATSQNEIAQNGCEACIGQDQPMPAPQQRLHQNLRRLRSLDRQLHRGQLKPSELLITIELVAFKVQHLARQIQEAENAVASPHCEG